MKTATLVAAAILLGPCVPAGAQVLRAAAVGCSLPADAQRIAALQATRNGAGAQALAAPLIATRSCMAFAKGIKVDIDEKKPPLTCVRLTGDLSCYWVATALVDEHPGEKGAGGRRGGGRRH